MEQPGAYKITEAENAVLGSPQEEQFSKTRLIPESQLRDAIKEILAEMLGVNATAAQPNRQWYDTENAYFPLGLNSAEQLREMTRNGMLRIGYEVRDVRSPDSQIPRYQFHIEKCEARLALPPEQRQAKKAKKTA